MAPLSFSFSDLGRHGSSGGSTFRVRAPGNARAADDAGARFEGSERSRETGRRKPDPGRRGIRGWRRV